MWQSIATTARNLDWTVNRVTSTEEALECFHKGNGVPAVAFIDCRFQNDKAVDAYQIARYVKKTSIIYLWLQPQTLEKCRYLNKHDKFYEEAFVLICSD